MLSHTGQNLLAQVAETICREKLLAEGDRVVIGVSGGADSIALTDLLVRFSREYLPISLALACLDHGLRSESRDEVARVAELAAGYRLVFFSGKVDLLAEGKQGLEKRARDGRLCFLQQAAGQFVATKIALAHHADDQAETVLLRLLQGSGIQGVSGMSFSRALGLAPFPVIIRPLLTIGKQQLIEYLLERKIKWCEDSSNHDVHFARNRMRHVILPFLRVQGYRQVSSALCRLGQRSQEITDYLQQQARDFWQRHQQTWCPNRPELAQALCRIGGSQCAWRLANADLAALAPALLPLVVQQIFADLGQPQIRLRESHYRSIQKLLMRASATIELPAAVFVHKNRTAIYFIKVPQQLSLPQKLDLSGTVTLSNHCQLKADRVEVVQFDLANYRRIASLLQPIIAADNAVPPFVVRYSQSGDKIQILGAPGRRKISRLLNDIGVPPPLRQQIIVVSDAVGRLLWLPGIGIAESCRIANRTQNLLQLSLVAVDEGRQVHEPGTTSQPLTLPGKNVQSIDFDGETWYTQQD